MATPRGQARMSAGDARASRLLSAAMRLPSVLARCEEDLSRGLSRWPDLRLVLLSMVDGGPFVARAIDGDHALDDLAAMNGDLFQLADALGRTLDIGGCRHVVVENERGVVVMVQVPQTQGRLSLCVVGEPDANMGMTMRAAIDIAQRLGQTLDSAVTPKSGN